MKKFLSSWYFVLLFVLLNSCGFVHKIFNKKQTEVHFSQQLNSDSSSVRRKDSAALSIKDSSHLKKEETLHRNGVEIQFDSSAANTIEIVMDTTGEQRIYAKGSIRSVKTKRLQATQQVDSLHRQKQREIAYQMLDSTNNTRQSNTALKEKTKTVSKDKKVWGLPWYGYIALLVVIILFLYLRFRKKIEEFLGL